MPLARADLESLLRAKRLDHTLTTALPSLDPPGDNDEYAVAATGVTALDARLGGGFPRGQLSELVGPRSSGRTSLLLWMLAAATARGELVALVDAFDRFDVASAEAAGIDLDRLLWIRGHVVTNPGLCRDTNARALDHALKAFTLVLQAGNFGLVAFDVADARPDALRRLPFTTWLRLQRLVEGSQTVSVLVGAEPMARSSAGLTLRLGLRDARFGLRLFDGLNIEARIVRARALGRSVLMGPLRRPVLDMPEHHSASASGVGEGPLRHPVLDMREDCGPSASASGGGAPRGLEDVCVPLSTTCA